MLGNKTFRQGQEMCLFLSTSEPSMNLNMFVSNISRLIFFVHNYNYTITITIIIQATMDNNEDEILSWKVGGKNDESDESFSDTILMTMTR